MTYVKKNTMLQNKHTLIKKANTRKDTHTVMNTQRHAQLNIHSHTQTHNMTHTKKIIKTVSKSFLRF